MLNVSNKNKPTKPGATSNVSFCGITAGPTPRGQPHHGKELHLSQLEEMVCGTLDFYLPAVSLRGGHRKSSSKPLYNIRYYLRARTSLLSRSSSSQSCRGPMASTGHSCSPRCVSSSFPLHLLPPQLQEENEPQDLDLHLYSPWQAAEPKGLESSEQIAKGPKVGVPDPLFNSTPGSDWSAVSSKRQKKTEYLSEISYSVRSLVFFLSGVLKVKYFKIENSNPAKEFSYF